MAQVPTTDAIYTGDGSTTQYAITFEYLEPEDVKVTVDEVNVSFTFAAPGIVNVIPAPANGAAIRVYRDTPAMEVAYVFSEGKPFLLKYADANWKKILFAFQESWAEFKNNARNYLKTLRVPEDITTLPSATERAGKIVSFDTDGQPLMLEVSIDSVPALDYRVTNLESARAYQVPNIAALSALTNVFIGQVVDVGAYATIGGGGTFQAIASSGQTIDGGTIFASSNPAIYWKRVNYAYVTSDMFGIDKTGATDVTAKLQLMINNFSISKITQGTYLIDTLAIPANRKVLTDDLNTLLKQKPQSGQKVIVDFIGSNSSIGNCAYQGNIATDPFEFNHAVNIAAGEGGKPNLVGIEVGNVFATNIRGDAVCVAAYTGYTCEVKIGDIYLNNVLRNGLSIVGGVDIEFGDITGGACGFCHLDIEPEPFTTGATNIRGRGVRGRHVGIQSADPAKFIDGVYLDYLDLSPSNAVQSTPSYAPGLTLVDALTTRNLKFADIKNVKISGFTGKGILSVTNPGELGTQYLRIGSLEISNCATGVGELDYVTGAITQLSVAKLTATVAADKRAFTGCTSINVDNANVGLGSAASLFRSCTNPTLENAVITGSGLVFNGCANPITFNTSANCDFFYAFSGPSVTTNSAITATTAFNDSGNTQHVLQNTTINTVYTASGTIGPGYINAMRLGEYYIWVEVATGKLRISSGKPASDSAGTVVGTQT